MNVLIYLVPIALAPIASGALGNAVDRVWKATVTDFLRVYISAPGAKQWLMETFGTAEWPSFNVADSTLLVGVVIFVIGLGLVLTRTSRKSPAESSAAAG